MGAVANVTTLANTVTVSRVLSAAMAPEFKKGTIFVPQIYAEDLPIGQSTATKTFRRRGAMGAVTALAENNPRTYESPRVDTSVDATAAKIVRVDGVSIENQMFSQNDLASYAESQGNAIGRSVDDTGFALFSSITNEVDAGGSLTLDHLDLAQLAIFSEETPNSEMNLHVQLGPKGYKDIKADVRESGGSALSNERFLSIFNGPPQVNGLVGQLPGFNIFMTPAGLASSGSNAVQAVFHPRWAFAGMFDSSVKVWIANKGSEGVFTEIVSYYFFAIVLWNDDAACKLLSAA